MNINIHVATIQIEEREILLTKSLAKQFMIRPFNYRLDRAVVNSQRISDPGPSQIRGVCKVLAKVLVPETQMEHTWLILAPDHEGGLSWQYPALFPDSWRAQHFARTGIELFQDDLEKIPTVLLP